MLCKLSVAGGVQLEKYELIVTVSEDGVLIRQRIRMLKADTGCEPNIRGFDTFIFSADTRACLYNRCVRELKDLR